MDLGWIPFGRFGGVEERTHDHILGKNPSDSVNVGTCPYLVSNDADFLLQT